jgi:hypothetical protein
MFVGSLMNITATSTSRGSYVRRGIDTDEHKANVAPGWSRDYVAYARRSGGTDECKGLRFVGSAWPTNMWPYFYLVTFLSYVHQFMFVGYKHIFIGF